MSFSGRAAVAAAAMIAAAPAAAQSGWTMIGQTAVAADASSGTITPRRSEARHREIMLCVEDRPLRLNDVTIRFQDGRNQNVRLRARIVAGLCGRMIELSVRNQIVDAVEIAYDPVTLEGNRARVQLYAR
jgi:hypothetical protein